MNYTKTILVLLFLLVFPFQVISDESVQLTLAFPKANIRVPSEFYKNNESYIWSGVVNITVKLSVNTGDYDNTGLFDLDFLLNNQVIDSQDNVSLEPDGTVSYVFAFDTTQQGNGKYILMVNLVDCKGNVAIVSKRIELNNISGE